METDAMLQFLVMEPALYIKPAGIKPLRRGHPWVFSGAVVKVVGRPEPGEMVRLLDREGRFVAWAWYSPASRLRARVVDRREGVVIDRAWLTERLKLCLAGRQRLLAQGAEALRLVNSEADGLPGLVVDRYGEGLVVQFSCPGAERLKDEIVARLQEQHRPVWVYERSDVAARRLEGLTPSQGPLMGAAPQGLVKIQDGGLFFFVDPLEGQKTGFYLDQGQNRLAVAAHAGARRVLDCFAYSGGFAIHALAAGAASAVVVDSSARALKLARENLTLNGLLGKADLVQGNVFEVLRQYRDARRRFDLIVLDPPNLAPTKAQASKAARAYKDLNLLALKLLTAEGVLATFSCSAGIEPRFFEEVLHWAAQDAGVSLHILARLGQREDHPVLAGFPESEYLKGMICRPVPF